MKVSFFLPPDKASKKFILRFFLLYTIVFWVLALFVLHYFKSNGFTLIRTGDGWVQHYKAFVYIVQYYRNIIRQLLHDHTVQFGSFNFALGYGSDILTTLNYYGIGDPLVLLGIPFPARYLYGVYVFLIFFRVYLSGLVFTRFTCYVLKKENRSCIGYFCGALIYTGSAYVLFAGLKHPFFMNTLIYFPWMLLGTEKILKEKKPYSFILSVFVSAISNFYFFYMMVIMEIMYVLWRLLHIYGFKQWKSILIQLLRFLFCSVIGVLMSCVILLPDILRFISDSRISEVSESGLFYNIAYYRNFLIGFTSYSYVGNWTMLGFGGIGLLGILLLFSKPKNLHLKIAFFILTVLYFFPAFGRMMNGFSYACNRWNWAYGLLVAFVFVKMWGQRETVSETQIKRIVIIIISYIFACILWDYAITRISGLQICFTLFAFVIFAVLKDGHGEDRILNILIITVTICGVIVNAWSCYSYKNENFMSEFRTEDHISIEDTNDGVAVASMKDNSFFRFCGDRITENSGLWKNLSSPQYYWSLSNGNISRFLKEMDNLDVLFYRYRGLDDRTFLNTLAGVKYYTTRKHDNTYVPYGYSKVGKYKQINIYENDYALPMGYTYDSIIPKETYDKLPSERKQQALLQGIVLEPSVNRYPVTDLRFDEINCSYDVLCTDGVSLVDDTFVVSKNNASVELSFEGMDNCETYLKIKGLNYFGSNQLIMLKDKSFDPENIYSDEWWKSLGKQEQNKRKDSMKYWNAASELSILVECFRDGEKVSEKNLKYYTPEYKNYSGHTDFIVNMCYSVDKNDSLRISFPETGKYKFDSLEVICQPMDHYAAYMKKLSEDTLEDIELHANKSYATNLVSASIDLHQPEILCLTIPYSDGWTAFVDDEEKPIMRANTMFMALELEPGKHVIQMKYMTPGLKVGCFLSLAGIVGFIGLIILLKKKDRYMVSR